MRQEKLIRISALCIFLIFSKISFSPVLGGDMRVLITGITGFAGSHLA